MLTANSVQLLVTDLDGSLLDHDDYGYDAAIPVLEVLEQMRIPVVFASSKTRVEILALRSELGNAHPFIVENGAAVLVPENYFVHRPEETFVRDGYHVHELAPARDHWTPVLDQLRQQMPDAFMDFAHAGAPGISAMTGLSPEAALLANEREYSEPLEWRSSEEQLEEFLAQVKDAGARVLKGGRFYSVAGDSDKGRAWQWLREQYRLAAAAATVYDLAVGDGANDVPMLEIANCALLIPAPGRALPSVQRSSNVIVGEGMGPKAWAWGVRDWLRRLYQAPEEL